MAPGRREFAVKGKEWNIQRPRSRSGHGEFVVISRGVDHLRLPKMRFTPF